jgi:putative heme-binding domain-containing protein
VAKDVEKQAKALLSPKGSIEVDERTNSLIISDVAANRSRIIELLTALDTQTSVLALGQGDPYKGKVLYTQSCGKCHILFDEGGRIGPNLTTYKRDDVSRILMNIVNPSAEIREGFESYLILTNEGRTATGFLFDQDNRVVVLRGVDGQNITLPRDQIEEMIPQKKSLMPEGLLKPLTPQQVRDLFAYLRSSQPLNN